ncbi:arginyl-tRNA synthetase [Pelobacter propionicus DSM 2379]|uniref:Arginine--tRNA ligase n=2 Tax=Pelobacter propionicus TaxID=29543 RepID=A1AMS5_PELPD|nr:arginine--tRNA ligase [Pelobacter propionicus]ABK98645.1 arginyl-tRNA synthetase [Pelobacter propionicus DSM 2379]
MMRHRIASLVETALRAASAAQEITSPSIPAVTIGVPANPDHGDYSCNIAMQMAKAERRAPRQVAETISRHLGDGKGLLSKTDIAGPGFINFFVSPAAWQRLLPEIESQGATYGRTATGEERKVQVEFVSANPTGPLHIGHGRGAAIGDTICRLLDAAGWNVTREFYYNDAGQQITNLALSVQARCLGIDTNDPRWPADGYQGEYIRDVAAAYLARETVDADDRHVTALGDPQNLDAIREFAVASLRREQDLDLKAFGVHFDVFTLESSLYDDGRVDNVVRQLVEKGHTYEQEGALWLRTTEFGDDKDRVMRKSDGGYTYFVPDVAYHLAKWERGFTRVINEQGSDHHSTITRVRAGLQALDRGIPQGWPEYVLHQMVTVMRGGEEVKISKRAGSYVTLRDLIDEVGRDATRFFFIMRKPDSQLVFDIDLAKEQSPDNPVYYVQYAHARICSIFENAVEKGYALPTDAGSVRLELLESTEELQLIKLLAALPNTVDDSARFFEPHRLTNYLTDLAASFHSFYNRNRVLTENSDLTGARLYLLKRTAQTLNNALSILGISAPERM